MEDSETIYGFDYEYGHYSNYTYDNVTPHEEKMKKMVNTTWYLSLAVSDVIFFACLHFNIYTVTKEWIFGLFMCKFTSFDIPEHVQQHHPPGRLSSCNHNHRWHNKCFTKYPSQNSHLTVAVSRFVSGFVLPLLIIFCYSVIILGLRTNRMTRSSKAFRVMTALIATFFISWLPCHVFINLEPDIKII
ncbi:unnamed protein product [Coregonus sp. 'balchen']|nr:unnamed protein product [Coregonus sp. 'balchen']